MQRPATEAAASAPPQVGLPKKMLSTHHTQIIIRAVFCTLSIKCMSALQINDLCTAGVRRKYSLHTSTTVNVLHGCLKLLNGRMCLMICHDAGFLKRTHGLWSSPETDADCQCAEKMQRGATSCHGGADCRSSCTCPCKVRSVC